MLWWSWRNYNARRTTVTSSLDSSKDDTGTQLWYLHLGHIGQHGIMYAHKDTYWKEYSNLHDERKLKCMLCNNGVKYFINFIDKYSRILLYFIIRETWRMKYNISKSQETNRKPWHGSDGWQIGKRNRSMEVINLYKNEESS